MTDSEAPGARAVLTWRQRRVLQAIWDYAAANGCAPSSREIAEAAGLKSASSAMHHLRGLKAAGYVSYEPGVPRTVRVLRAAAQARRPAAETGEVPGRGTDRVVWVPIAGQVRAGEPILPLEAVEESMPLPSDVVGQEEGLFILQVVGDSMIGVGIFPGDWVVVRELFEKPRNGDIVAALLDGIEVEGTVKTYRKLDRRIWLMPQNPAYTPIPGDKAMIRGKVVAVLRRLG
jgi:repressor LexA